MKKSLILSAVMLATAIAWGNDSTPQKATDNCVLSMSMQMADGKVKDDSGKDNIGKLMGKAVVKDGVLILDGKKSYLNCGRKACLDIGMGNMTLVVKVKLTPGKKPYSGLITKGAASNKDAGFALIYQNKSDRLLSLLSDGHKRLWHSSTGPLGLKDGKWHIVAVVYFRDDNVKFYVDGKNVGEAHIKQLEGKDITAPKHSLLIGSWIGSWFLTGEFKFAKVYKQALSADAIKAIQ